MEKAVQTSLNIMSFGHSIKEFHSASRLSGLGISEDLENRLHTDIPKYKTVHPLHSMQGDASKVFGFFSGCLARHRDSVGAGMKLLCRKFRKKHEILIFP